jgi:hypothetical protein
MRVGDTVAVPLQMSNQTFSTGAGDFAQIVVTASNDCTLTPERPTNQVFPRKGTSSLWGWKLKATGIGACSLNWRAILSRNRGVLVAAKRWDDTIAVTAPVFTRTYIRNIILALVIGAFLVIAAVVAAYLTRNRGDL